MFSLTLLCLNLALFLYILVYGLCFLFLPFVRPGKKPALAGAAGDRDAPESSVAVIVPCHNEGPGLVRTVESILEQDYRGPVHAVVLFKDSEDSSFEPLKARFNFHWKKGAKSQIVFKGENRELTILLTGFQQKKDKLNFYLPKIQSEFIAFLDADHRANPDWLSCSVRKFTGSSFAGVQSRRSPLSMRKLAQLWDSSQNHIGNELVNSALDRVTGGVFFTGTTCVFRTEKLRGRKFGDCVTEDTWLSYELLADGERIAYEGSTGSHEEVSPDIHSYVARRRRWSCGHNKTFFALFPKVAKADVGWRSKAATLIHGLFYTVPVAVCFLLNIYALHLFVQYTKPIQILIGLIAFLLSAVITLLMFGRHKRVLREMIVLFFWLLPQVTLIFPMALYFSEHELYFFLTLFPYASYLFYSHAFCLFAPVVLLFAGSRRIRILQPYQFALLFLSYPLFFFLDLWACLLGFSDFIFGRPTWAKIQRTHAEDFKEGATTRRWVLTRWAGACAVLLFLLISFNDLTADSNCGEPEGLLFDPRIFVPTAEVDWTMKKYASLKDADTLSVNFTSDFSKPLSGKAEIAHFLDGRLVQMSKEVKDTQAVYHFESPLGWESHKYEAVLRNKGALCRRTQLFTTALKEFRDKKLFVNGEPFLVKGVIPSFSPGDQKELTPLGGLEQIKYLGANSVRFYHAVREAMKDAAATTQLLVIDQPDRSTWSDVTLTAITSRLQLRLRYEDLVLKNRNYPYTLFHSLGNELEIMNPMRDIHYLAELMKEVIAKSPMEDFAYSTFFVYLKLPAAIYGVNMLDSGDTYWKKGVETIRALNKPFYASEFGGFVANFEWTPPELRMYRIQEYFGDLMNAGAFGIVLHQSHDNWAQPVVDGFNDPLSPDRPDDLRGIWDRANKPKSLARFLEDLFSDFETSVENETLSPDDRELKLTFKNRRSFALRHVEIFSGERKVAGPLDFGPGEAKELSLSLSSKPEEELSYTAKYSTHHGLAQISQIHLRLPLHGARPVILDTDLLSISGDSVSVDGTLLHGGEFTAVFPEKWKQVRLNGSLVDLKGGRQTFPIRSSMEVVTDLEGSDDGKTFHPIQVSDVGNGPQRVRFKLARNYPAGAKLILAGLGTETYYLRTGNGEWAKMTGHQYRQNLISLDDLKLEAGEYISLLLPRTATVFINAKEDPRGKDVTIDFEMPRVFSPADFHIEKVS